MKNNETTKKERIINGVLIAAGIGAATYIGVNLFKQELALRAFKKRLEETDTQIRVLEDIANKIEHIKENNNIMREALQEVYGNEE